MREIKFRAWDKNRNRFLENGEMLLGNIIAWKNNKEFSVGYTGDYELMQYTGLKDKNGKEIYEGDIVKGVVKFPQLTTFDTDENSNYKMCGKVYYDHSGFSLKCIQALCQKDRYGMVNYFDFISGDGEIFDEMEIIGNEFENPGLINNS